MSVPIIDLGPWFEGKKSSEVAQLWNSAFLEYGCAIIVGHGVSMNTFDSLLADADVFFSLPVEKKIVYK